MTYQDIGTEPTNFIWTTEWATWGNTTEDRLHTFSITLPEWLTGKK